MGDKKLMHYLYETRLRFLGKDMQKPKRHMGQMKMRRSKYMRLIARCMRMTRMSCRSGKRQENGVFSILMKFIRECIHIMTDFTLKVNFINVEQYCLMNFEKGYLRKVKVQSSLTGKKYGVDTRVFINSLGLPTYEGKELALAEKEFSEFGNLDKNIHVVTPEQTSFFRLHLKSRSLSTP